MISGWTHAREFGAAHPQGSLRHADGRAKFGHVQLRARKSVWTKRPTSCSRKVRRGLSPTDRARIHRGSLWRHLISERWQDEDCGRLTDLKWPRILLSMQDLQARALAEIRKQPGCSSVRNIVINHVTDERAENNWSLCVLSAGNADANTAARAALYVQQLCATTTI